MNITNVLAHYGLRKAHPAAAELDHYGVRHGGLSICASKLAALKTAATNLKAVLKKWPQFVPEIEKGLKMLRSALRGTPAFGRVSEALIEIQMRLEDDHRSDPAAFRARSPFNAALADFAKSEFERKTGNRWASTKKADVQKTARKLHKRQEKVLQKYLDGGGSETLWDFLPTKVQQDLLRIKDSEFLQDDVVRWLEDNNNPHLQSRWASGWIDEAVVSLAEEEGVDADDMKVQGKTPYGRGYNIELRSGRGDSGESEWMVFKSSGDAEKAALEYVTEMLEEEPEMFTQSWLRHYVEIKDAGTIAQEDADNVVDDMKDDELLERTGKDDNWQELEEEWDTAEERIEEIKDEFEEVGVGTNEWTILEVESSEVEKRQESVGEEMMTLVEVAREALRDSWAEDLEDRIKSDPTGWLEEMGYDPDQYSKLNFVSIDVASAAKAAIRDDGVAHFLDRYDGDETELDRGAVAFGTN